MSPNIVLEQMKAKPGESGAETTTRRSFMLAAGAAGLCYITALGYPVYRYLASPAEMAASASAVSRPRVCSIRRIDRRRLARIRDDIANNPDRS